MCLTMIPARMTPVSGTLFSWLCVSALAARSIGSFVASVMQICPVSRMFEEETMTWGRELASQRGWDEASSHVCA